MKIEVIHALRARQDQVEIELPDGATIAQAIEYLAQMPECSGWQIDESAIGVFGQLRPMETVLETGDRLELYRPLIVDPKAARRLRAESQRAGN
jgi:putative ubiquitin-RnfH superfamily antitoxin RatB of RatAB toxin-antitoxin module